MCCCIRNQCAVFSRNWKKKKMKLKVKTHSYHVLHLFTSLLRVHISRLLSKFTSKLRNDLRSNVFNFSLRLALHVSETDIMYNILKTRSSLPHRRVVSKTYWKFNYFFSFFRCFYMIHISYLMKQHIAQVVRAKPMHRSTVNE